jgi:hypothetical protein
VLSRKTIVHHLLAHSQSFEADRKKNVALCWGGKIKILHVLRFLLPLRSARQRFQFIVANDMQRMKRRQKNVS